MAQCGSVLGLRAAKGLSRRFRHGSGQKRLKIGLHVDSGQMYFFQSSRPHSSQEKCDENFNVKNYFFIFLALQLSTLDVSLKIGEKKRLNKGMNKQQQPDSGIYMIHLPTVHVCTKFQSSRPHSSREKCDEKF